MSNFRKNGTNPKGGVPLTQWQEQVLSCLALIIVLDRFTRNRFGDSAKAFATDLPAIKLSKVKLVETLKDAPNS